MPSIPSFIESYNHTPYRKGRTAGRFSHSLHPTTEPHAHPLLHKLQPIRHPLNLIPHPSVSPFAIHQHLPVAVRALLIAGLKLSPPFFFTSFFGALLSFLDSSMWPRKEREVDFGYKENGNEPAIILTFKLQRRGNSG